MLDDIIIVNVDVIDTAISKYLCVNVDSKTRIE